MKNGMIIKIFNVSLWKVAGTKILFHGHNEYGMWIGTNIISGKFGLMLNYSNIN